MQEISIIGCGWLGMPLAVNLLEKGYRVKGSTRSPDKVVRLKSMGIRPFLLTLDPTDDEVDPDLFAADYCVVNIPPRDPVQDYHKRQLTFLKTKLIENNTRNVIFVGSTGIYPDNNRKVHEEDASQVARSRGGANLWEAEQVFMNEKRLNCTVVRFGGLYGPGRHPIRYLSGKTTGCPECPVNMIHQDDCIGVIETILVQGAWNQIFNAVSTKDRTRKEFYMDAASRLGVEPPLFKNDSGDFKKVSSDKLVGETGYQFLY